MLWCVNDKNNLEHSEEVLKNFTVLYVEDDPNTMEYIKEILKDSVKEFYQASNGKDGLEIVKTLDPDIIITDISLPKLDGLEMAKEIKKFDCCKPIVIFSAFDDKETLLKAVNIGVNCFVPKPIDIDFFYEHLIQIAQILQNKIDAEQARQEHIEKLHYKAHYDFLTKIPNRLLFQQKLEKAISKAKRNNSVFTLFFIDLDDFKMVNDTYGHQAGDFVLQQTTKKIQNVIRLEDTLCRISGDEFSLIIEEDLSVQHIKNLASKVIEACTQPIIYNEHIIKISCSIGISQYPKNGTSKEELIGYADKAMYKAKELPDEKYSF